MNVDDLYRMIFDIDKMIICAIIGGLIMLAGGFIVFSFVIENQIPTLGVYVMISGILIVVIGPLSISIFENINGWIKKHYN